MEGKQIFLYLVLIVILFLQLSGIGDIEKLKSSQVTHKQMVEFSETIKIGHAELKSELKGIHQKLENLKKDDNQKQDNFDKYLKKLEEEVKNLAKIPTLIQNIFVKLNQNITTNHSQTRQNPDIIEIFSHVGSTEELTNISNSLASLSSRITEFEKLFHNNENVSQAHFSNISLKLENINENILNLEQSSDEDFKLDHIPPIKNYTVIVFGLSGSGKSRLLNFISNFQANFNESRNLESETLGTHDYIIKNWIHNSSLKLIDTQGFFDNRGNITNDAFLKQFIDSVFQNKTDEIDLVMYCVQPTHRFSEPDLESIKMLSNILKIPIQNFVIVVTKMNLYVRSERSTIRSHYNQKKIQELALKNNINLQKINVIFANEQTPKKVKSRLYEIIKMTNSFKFKDRGLNPNITEAEIMRENLRYTPYSKFVDGLEEELKNTTSIKEKLEVENRDLKNTKVNLEKELTISKSTIDKLEGKNKELENQVSELKRKNHPNEEEMQKRLANEKKKWENEHQEKTRNKSLFYKIKYSVTDIFGYSELVFDILVVGFLLILILSLIGICMLLKFFISKIWQMFIALIIIVILIWVFLLYLKYFN